MFLQKVRMAVLRSCPNQGCQSTFQKNSKRFNPKDMEIEVKGKICVVTGANSGIGYSIAESLASRGANVYLVCRSKEKGEAAVSMIKSNTDNPNVYLEVCDLSSISEIKSFASRFTSVAKLLHVLANNAGLMEHNHIITPEGLELNFAVNVAATYALTDLLMPLLKRAAPDARVITVSSGAMYAASLNEDLQFTEAKFDGTMQYARNKRVQVALTEKWAEIYRDYGVGFYSMTPGLVGTSLLSKSMSGSSQELPRKARTSEQGADTAVWLALQLKEKLVSGAFFFDRAEARKHLPLFGTAKYDASIDRIIDKLQSLCGLSSN